MRFGKLGYLNVESRELGSWEVAKGKLGSCKIYRNRKKIAILQNEKTGTIESQNVTVTLSG